MLIFKQKFVSHLKERKEKTCLNCGAALHGLYCHECGQENIEPKQSAWHLVTHFFYDITHFDGKFFTTLKDLIAKPGFLSREFINGRRVSYLNPVRMYVFTSAFFFIVFFAIYKVEDMHIGGKYKNGKTAVNLSKAEQSALAGAETKEDSLSIKNAFSKLKAVPIPDPADDDHDSTDHDYKSVQAYDSAEAALAPDMRDGWLKRLYMHKKIELNEKYHDDKEAMIRNWIAAFMHNFPKMLFISLPLFALLLKLLYIRRKQFYYADHGIFAIHLYIFSFIALLFYFGIQKLKDISGWSWLNWLNTILFFFSLFYFYKAMRNFYRQRRAKTIVKYTLLFFMSFIMIVFLFSVFFLFSILEV